jgi:hypothetical protein
MTAKAEFLEAYVASLLQEARHFVEKNITERGLLELDCVATAYPGGKPQQILIEVKSGHWGFADIFKVRGWMSYLGISTGAFVATRCESVGQLEYWRRKAECFGIKLIVSPIGSLRNSLAKCGFAIAKNSYLSQLWRLSYGLEKWMLMQLAMRRLDLETGRLAFDYYRLVNDELFFTDRPIDRVKRLYDAYGQHPKLTFQASTELWGHRDFDVIPPKGDNLFREATIAGKYPYLQACMYVEHRARLSLLKAAIDHLCSSDRDDLWTLIQEVGQPATFRAGLGWLKKQGHFANYPLLWQVFLWTCGGFLLTNRLGSEYAYLADQSGVPKSEVPTALQCFDQLFPIEDGWFVALPKAHISLLKLVPVQFRGVGAVNVFYRYKRSVKTHFTSGDVAERLWDWFNTIPREVQYLESLDFEDTD